MCCSPIMKICREMRITSPSMIQTFPMVRRCGEWPQEIVQTVNTNCQKELVDSVRVRKGLRIIALLQWKEPAEVSWAFVQDACSMSVRRLFEMYLISRGPTQDSLERLYCGWFMNIWLLPGEAWKRTKKKKSEARVTSAQSVVHDPG